MDLLGTIVAYEPRKRTRKFRDPYGRIIAIEAIITPLSHLDASLQTDIKEAFNTYEALEAQQKRNFSFYLAESMGCIYVEGTAIYEALEPRAFIKIEDHYYDPEAELTHSIGYSNYFTIVEGKLDDLRGRFNFNSNQHLIEQFVNYERDLSEEEWQEMLRQMMEYGA